MMMDGIGGRDGKYDDGWFSDDPNHREYQCDSLFYEIHRELDYCDIGTMYSDLTFEGDGTSYRAFRDKRNRLAKHWYHMFRNSMIKF